MRLSASITFMFRELPLLDRFGAARAAGFAGVEIQRLSEGNVADMALAARDAGIAVALVNVSAGDYTSGGDGLSGVPGREDDFREAFEQALHAAGELGAAHLHLGPSRVPDGATRQECLLTYLANVRMALSISRAVGASLLVEGMNRPEAPTALLPDVGSAADVVRCVRHQRLGLQFDAYHAAMNGGDPMQEFTRHRDVVRHVQFADAPGRHEPGTGRLDLVDFLHMVERDGYAGWCGAEYHPSGATLDSLRWMEQLRGAIPA